MLKPLCVVLVEALEPRFKAIAPTYLGELGNDFSENRHLICKTFNPPIRER